MLKSIVSFALLAAAPLSVGQDRIATLDLAERLEEAVYLQEARNDLDGAIQMYQGILAESQLVESLAAEAKYRLAICYLDQGKKTLAYHTLRGIVEDHPGEAHWLEEAKRILPQDFQPEITPWSEGERSHYEWLSPGGVVMGHSFSTLRRVEGETGPLWRKESRYFLNGERSIAVEFEPDSFHTVLSELRAPELGDVIARYSDDGTSVEVQYEKNDTRRAFHSEERMYDNEQAYELMRQMPLEVGYTMTKTIFVSLSGMPLPIVFNVVSIEELDTVLGAVDCYQVELELPGAKQQFYMTADERRLLVRLTVGGIEARLMKVDVVQPGTWSVYHNDEYGFSVTHPDEWVPVEQPRKDEWDEVRVQFGEPSMRGGFSLYSAANAKLPEASRSDIDTLVSYLQEEEAPRRKDAEMDLSWSRRLRLAEGEAVGFKMKQKEEGKTEYDRYTFIVRGDSRHYVFHAFLNEVQVSEQLPKFERLVQSLSLK